MLTAVFYEMRRHKILILIVPSITLTKTTNKVHGELIRKLLIIHFELCKLLHNVQVKHKYPIKFKLIPSIKIII